MDKFRKLLDNELDSKLIKITLSGRKKASASENSDKKDFSGVSKISVRPVEIKGGHLQDVKQAHVCRKVTAVFYWCHPKDTVLK